MLIHKQHSLFKNRANKLNTNHYQDLFAYQIDDAINRAVFFFMENFAMVNKLPYESTQQRYDMLGNLVIPDEEVSVTLVKDGVYEMKTSDLNNIYSHAVSLKTDCVSFAFKTHDSLHYSLDDAFQQPNSKWGQGLVKVAKSSTGNTLSLYIYSDVVLETVLFTYLKEPTPVFFGNYNSVDYIQCQKEQGVNCNQYYNVSTTPKHCEISSRYCELIVDIAGYLTLGQTENIHLKQLLENNINIIT